MMYKFLFTALLFALWTNTSIGQSSYSYDDIYLDFEGNNYKMKKATFFDQRTQPHGKGKDGSDLLLQSFKTADFDTYRSYFMPGECHVSLETFVQWKDGLGQHTPVLLSHVILLSGQKKYAITKYFLSYNNTRYLLANAQKEVNGKWYFLGLEENIELQPMIRFFTYSRDSFLIQLSENTSPYFKEAMIFSDQQVLRATYLSSNVLDKYKVESKLFPVLNEIFENTVQPIERTARQRFPDFAAYIKLAPLTESEYAYILNLVNASLIAEAMNYFLEKTGKTMEVLFEECPNALIP